MKIDIINELSRRNIEDSILSIASHLSVPEIRKLRLVSREWNSIIQEIVFNARSYKEREMVYNLKHSKPCLIDLDKENDVVPQILTVTNDWNGVIERDKEL